MTEQELLQRINELESKLLDSYDLKPVVYIGFTETKKNICKFGYTNDLKARLSTHRSQISEHFKPEYIIETIYNREVEKDIKLHLSQRIINKRYNGKLQTELILLDDEFDVTQLYDLIIQYKDSYNDKNVIQRLTREIEELTTDKNQKQIEMDEIDNTIVKKQETIKKIKGSTYKCSACNYTSEFKSNVVKHINKAKKCSNSELEVLSIETDIICSHCNKSFSDVNSRNRHLKTVHQ